MGARDLNSLLDSKQICEFLNISLRTFRTMTDAGELPIVRIGRRVMADKRDLELWIKRRTLQVK